MAEFRRKPKHAALLCGSGTGSVSGRPGRRLCLWVLVVRGTRPCTRFWADKRIRGHDQGSHTSRDFLLFLPADTPGLKAVLNYFTHTITLNAEGDTQLNDESVASLGTAPTFISSLFGSIFRIATPRRQTRDPEPPPPTLHLPPPQSIYTAAPSIPDANSVQESPIYILSKPDPANMPGASTAASPVLQEGEFKAGKVTVMVAMPSQFRHSEPDFNENIDCTPKVFISKRDKSELTSFFPPAGYFLAGGISGVVSRTVTAPLDRLKVYLIANTATTRPTVKGTPIQVAKGVGGPLIDACRVLWKTGGIRSLFAGTYDLYSNSPSRATMCHMQLQLLT